MRSRQPSLKRALIVQPLILQLVLALVAFTAFMALLLRVDSGGRYTDQTVTEVAAAAIVREADGGLAVRMTPKLAKLRGESADLWFVAKDTQGRSVSFGRVPAEYGSVAATLDHLSYADIRGAAQPYHLSAVIRRQASPVGDLTILGHGGLSAMTLVTALLSNVIIAPIFLILALVTLITIPLIVNRSLAGVARIAREAESIDAEQRGIRLSEKEVPREIEPLVRAVNAALSRLDEGYNQQRRFITSAAHELRTPIAILQVKIESADAATQRLLAADLARLANLAEQLLDLHRLDNDVPGEPVDLPRLVRRVAADLAPLMIAADKTIEVQIEAPQLIVGNSGAIERVLINLVQNAVEHGGAHVLIRLDGTTLEVEDDGPGVPTDAREVVFEAFHRLRPRSTGAGLGLHLVRQVVEHHRGRVTILEAPGGGTIVRVDLPAAEAPKASRS